MDYYTLFLAMSLLRAEGLAGLCVAVASTVVILLLAYMHFNE